LGVVINVAQPSEIPEGSISEPESPLWTLNPKHVSYFSGKNIKSIFAAGNYTLALAG
jgi:hypothetical protein